jgi:NADH dehydrogenase FAD-containing subunit
VEKHILVLGGGFAGLWSAIGAARKLFEQKAETEAEITLVDRTTYHNIRVRHYAWRGALSRKRQAHFCAIKAPRLPSSARGEGQLSVGIT